MQEEINANINSEPANEQEQAQYEEAVQLAMKTIHEGKSADAIFQNVVNAKTPIEGIAKAAFVVIRRVEVSQKGLDDAVKLELAEDIIDELIGLMIDSERLSQGEVDEAFYEKVIGRTYALYQEDAEQRGTIDTDVVEEDLKALGISPEKPQGMNVMSNQEVERRGLMNVGGHHE